MAKNNKKNDEVEFDVVDGAAAPVKQSATSFIEENQGMVLGLLAALVLIVGGYMAYKTFVLEPKEKEATAQLFKAEAQFSQDSFALALENPGGGYEGFLDIIDNYGGTKAANTAKYYAGISYLNMGRFDDAISFLKDFSAHGDLTPITKAGAIGDSYAEKGDFDSALPYYKNAAGYNNEVLGPYYLNKLGLLYLKQGDNSNAVSAFESILEKYPLSTEAKDAEKNVLKLK